MIGSFLLYVMLWLRLQMQYRATTRAAERQIVLKAAGIVALAAKQRDEIIRPPPLPPRAVHRPLKRSIAHDRNATRHLPLRCPSLALRLPRP